MGVITRFAEKKFRDYTFTSVAFEWSASGAILDLSTVPQDVTDSSRVGDKLLLSSLEMRGVLYSSPLFAPTGAEIFMRMIIFKWWDDTAPTPNDILQTTGVFGIVAPLDHDRKPKRSIIMDRTWSATWNAALFQLDQTHKYLRSYFDFKKKSMKFRTISYQAGSTTTAVGKIYALCISNVPTPFTTENVPLLHELYFRINYTDV